VGVWNMVLLLTSLTTLKMRLRLNFTSQSFDEITANLTATNNAL
jgi:hypothetical protein